MHREKQKISRGLFVTVEGTDGCGKSTQLRMAVKHLKLLGYPVRVFKDPGGTRVGEEIRRILLAKKSRRDPIDSVAEALLYLASRRVLVSRLIEPALARGKLVLCDRFTDSTLAYQGFGRGLFLPELRTLCSFASGGLKPDLTFLLDIDPAVGLTRVKGTDRIEALGLAFQEKVRRGYLELARREPKRIKVISADGSPGEVFSRILPYLARLKASHYVK
ncbi:MAG: dTMP kinase [Candidatus Omnitrophica bacterium]|nr:dTMP kinase [Candidatus Omnitrophota bacterium]